MPPQPLDSTPTKELPVLITYHKIPKAKYKRKAMAKPNSNARSGCFFNPLINAEITKTQGNSTNKNPP